MSSATRFESDAGRKIIGAAGSQILDPGILEKISRLGMAPRQQALNHLWSIYRCVQYEARKVGWDGSEHVEGIEAEAIGSAGFLPPGFYSAGATFPLKFRRPNVTYSLAKVIVDRFTGLLFSERRHPSFRVEGDPQTEDFVMALAEASRLWQTAILARTMGGAMGTVAVGFQFVNGKPVVEVHDPRWCTPSFLDITSLELDSLEIRYMKPEDVRDPQTGIWGTENIWYRRVITTTQDIVYLPEPVGDGMEPFWEIDTDRSVMHNFGFVPVVWIQNLPVLDDVDGDPDCHGTYDTIAAIDALLSQSNRGIIANCDPTPVLSDDGDISTLSHGSDNAIKVTKGGDFKFAEMAGTGPKASREFAAELRSYVLEVAQCVLDQTSTTARTATEIERTYSSMLSKADVFREQYGQRGFLPLMEKMVLAVRAIAKPKLDAASQKLVRQQVMLPARYEKSDKGIKEIARQIGPGGVLKLQWGPYFAPTLDDAKAATMAAVSAVAGEVIDAEHAVKFCAPYFNVEDVTAMRDKIKAQGGDAGLSTDEMMQRAMSEQKASPAAEQTHFYQYEIEGGIFTINEVRASKGMGPLATDGDLSVPQYRAKYAKIFAESTATQAATSAEKILGMTQDNPQGDTGNEQ